MERISCIPFLPFFGTVVVFVASFVVGLILFFVFICLRFTVAINQPVSVYTNY